VLSSGTATWYLHYDVQAGKRWKRRKHKIGRMDDVALADAVAEAELLRTQIRRGADPVREKVAIREVLTFGELAIRRFETGDPLRPGTLNNYEHILKKDVLPSIGSLPAKAIKRSQIVDVLDLITQRGASRCADQARALISSIFEFGIDRGVVAENPAAGIRNRYDYQPRDVVASPETIRRLWSMDASKIMSGRMIIIMRLLLITGLRRAEIAAARKDELDLISSQPILTIPSGRAKNRHMHRVPLSKQAVALFRQAIEAARGSEFIFPDEHGLSHISPLSVTKAMERARAKLGMSDLSVHDLRRTTGTYLSQLGVPKDVRERILNHGGKRKSSLTDGVYNRYEYDAEKRAALELWADALDCIIQGKQAFIEDYHARLARLHGTGTVCVG
jgi:integrase